MYKPKHSLDSSDKKTLRWVWAVLVGGALFYAAVWEILPLAAADGLDKIDWFGIGGMVFLALVCAVPWIFLTILGDIVVIAKKKLGIKETD